MGLFLLLGVLSELFQPRSPLQMVPRIPAIAFTAFTCRILKGKWSTSPGNPCQRWVTWPNWPKQSPMTYPRVNRDCHRNWRKDAPFCAWLAVLSHLNLGYFMLFHSDSAFCGCPSWGSGWGEAEIQLNRRRQVEQWSYLWHLVWRRERERGSKTTWSKVIAEADLVLLVLQAMERERWPVNVWYWLNNNTVHLLTVYCYWYWSDRSSLNRAVGCQWIRHSAGSSLFCFWKSTIRWCGIHTHLFSSRVTIYIIIIWQCYHSILWVLPVVPHKAVAEVSE